jgi:glycosyltransferase involved in cell wall biosynthesis
MMFVHTSLVVGGAETQQVSLIKRLDRARFAPEVCCLKDRGPLASELGDVPVHNRLLRHKYDAVVIRRLQRLFRERRTQIVVTCGAGDKMFWGRIAARMARVPVVVSCLHTTGWPDEIGRLNHLLTPLNDAFVGVADAHGRHLVDVENFPAGRVHVIRNGVDTERFQPAVDTNSIRSELGLAPDAQLVIIVARLSTEKNHRLFLDVAARLRDRAPGAHFLIVGDGPLRESLQARAAQQGISDRVHFLGIRRDVPTLLAAADVFALTSDMEASPMSILEALACGTPVVATRVGSVPETVRQGATGFLVPPGDVQAMADCLLALLTDPDLARRMGTAGRRLVLAEHSIDRMVEQYEELFQKLYSTKCPCRERATV